MTVTLLPRSDQTSYYQFSAQTLREAQNQINLNGPSDSEGRHAASCRVQAGILDGLNRGIVSGSTARCMEMQVWTSTAFISQGILHYLAIYQYPRWVNVHLLPQAIQAEWQRFYTCLVNHEQGHLRESMPLLREYRELFASLLNTSTGASGDQAETAAKDGLMDQIRDLCEQLSFRCQQTNQGYDTRTRHGRTQGAQLRIQPTVHRASSRR